MMVQRVAVSAVILGSLLMFSCGSENPAGSTPSSPTADQSLATGGDPSALSGSGGGNERSRLRADLEPVFAVDASGNARSEDRSGTADDRFDSQVEVAKAHFQRVGIDSGDGFADEQVLLVVSRGAATIFSTRLRFSENRLRDITFEADIRGAAAPELRAGDVARVRINNRATLEGVFRVD